MRRGLFDFVSADQVVHHTPDAYAAVRSLAALLAPGGTLAFYVYKRKAPMREYADDFMRERTTRMSVDECMDFSASMSELGRKLSDVGTTITLDRPIPLLGIEAGEHDVQRLIYWHFLKCFWNDDFSPNLNDLVNFDWYHPPYASRHTEDEVRGWCDALGLTIDAPGRWATRASASARRAVPHDPGPRRAARRPCRSGTGTLGRHRGAQTLRRRDRRHDAEELPEARDVRDEVAGRLGIVVRH